MRQVPAAFALAILAVASVSGGSQEPARTPVIVELFTSEGCSSCPPADAFLTRLLSSQPIDTVLVIPLEFHVDYWNRLGWTDPFSSAAHSKRQRDYSAIFGPDSLYTPQMVMDGEAPVVGTDEVKVLAAIRAAAAKVHLPLRVSAVARGASVRLSVEAPASPAGAEPISIVVAIVEDGLVTAVRRGENSGKTLPHSAVVRRAEAIGALERDTFVGEGEWPLKPAWQRSSLRIVAFLQGQKTRRIYGAAATPPLN